MAARLSMRMRRTKSASACSSRRIEERETQDPPFANDAKDGAPYVFLECSGNWGLWTDCFSCADAVQPAVREPRLINWRRTCGSMNSPKSAGLRLRSCKGAKWYES